MKAFSLFFKLLRANYKLVLLFFVIFIGMMNIAMKVMAPSVDADLQLNQAKVTIFDEDHSNVSKAFTEYFATNGERIELEDDPERITDALFEAKTYYVIRIPSGFETQMLDPENEEATLEVRESVYRVMAMPVKQMIESYNHTFQIYKKAYGGTIPRDQLSDVLQAVESDLSSTIETHAQTEVAQSKTALLAYQANFSNYVILAMLFSILGRIFLTMEEKDVKRRDLVAGVPEQRRTLGIFAGTVVFGLAIYATLLLIILGLVGFDVITSRGTYLMIAVGVMHLFAILALILFFVTLIDNQAGVNFFSTVFSLAIAFTSGIFVPQEFLMEPVMRLSSFFPSYWAVSANNTIANLANTTPDYSPIFEDVSVLALMTIAYLCMTVVLRRHRRSS